MTGLLAIALILAAIIALLGLKTVAIILVAIFIGIGSVCGLFAAAFIIGEGR